MNCPILESKLSLSRTLCNDASGLIRSGRAKKLNAIWLEATGCSGNIISFVNSENPNLACILASLINLRYNNSIMGAEGSMAYQQFLDTLDAEFVLMVDGAISVRDNGVYTVVAKYNGRWITAQEAVKLAGEKAKYVLSVGTCASYGGMSAANPNPSGCVSVPDFLNRDVIKLPGCPCHPDWVAGTLAHLVSFGMPQLDDDNRPLMFYKSTIHDLCTRRSFFDKRIFAKRLGDKECMFKLGCRGPVTKADCPSKKWNGYVSWPVGDNTPCIGCTQRYFPDGMEPFVRY